MSQRIAKRMQKGGEAAISAADVADQPHDMTYNPHDPNEQRQKQAAQNEMITDNHSNTHDHEALRPLTPPAAFQSNENERDRAQTHRNDDVPQLRAQAKASPIDPGFLTADAHTQPITTAIQHVSAIRACGNLAARTRFQTARNRAEKLAALAMQGNDAKLQTIAQAQSKTHPGAAQSHGNDVTSSTRAPHDEATAPILRPIDFTTAFGSPGINGDSSYYETVDALSKAWEADGDVLHYDGAHPVEADAPPDKNSRAASGWQPMLQWQAAQQAFPAPPDHDTQNAQAYDNVLFESYGASYREAYAAAVALEFSEEMPLPDDDIGDVTGPVDNILYMPSGEPILLGTTSTAEETEADTDDGMENSESRAVETISLGRKIVRYLLLVIGGATVMAAVLYFAGYFP